MKKKDLLGYENDYFTVISEGPHKGKRTAWNCICKRCGQPCLITTDDIIRETVKSCGCLHHDILVEKNKQRRKDYTNLRFGSLICKEYAGTLRQHAAWKCLCDCGNYIITDTGSLAAGYVTSCGCRKRSSGEQIIENILQENNILYKKEYSFHDLVSENNYPLRFDFAIFDDNNNLIRIIEYDGEQHFQKKADKIFSDTLENRQARDKQKNLYCLQHNIPLVRIPYTHKTKITYNLLFENNDFLVKGE